MKKNFSSTYSIILILVCISSSLYFNPENSVIKENDSFFDKVTDIVDEQELEIFDNDISYRIKKIETPGSYQLRGFFSQDSFVDLDSDGDIIEWADYEDIKDDGWDSSNILDFRIDSNYQTNPDCWPDQNDTYYYLKDIDYPYPVSAMFSPVFEEETFIDGKVHFLTYLKTDFTGSTPPLNITFRIRLLLFNTTDTSTSEILSVNDTLVNSKPQSQITYSQTLSSPVTIPAGFRLKVVYEAKLSTLLRDGRMYIYGGESAPNSLNWNINDGEYSNGYSIQKTDEVLGIQLKMFDETYPNISVSGIANNTVYQQNKTISIDVSGAVDSSYRWDYGTYTSFDTSTTTDLPSTREWHTLEIQALDEYENKKTLLYQIGYDATAVTVVLQSPNNNSVIGEGDIIDFDVFNIDNATYEWDLSGTQTNLTSPDYSIIAPGFSGIHNLTIRAFDVFGVQLYFYIFEFDVSPPNVELVNVVNDTYQPAGKRIDVNITDPGEVFQVFHQWDTTTNFTWDPFDETIYITYLPESPGEHWLYVSAIDDYGNAISLAYNFTCNPDTILIELRNANNDSFYQGGEIIEVTLTGINGTIYYDWDKKGEENGSVYYSNSILLLDESNVLPDDPVGVHNLTIRTFDSSDTEYIRLFIFTLDQEAPQILTSQDEYNNKRFLNTDILEFAFDDNFTQLSQLYVVMSIDGVSNQTLVFPYNFELLSLSDGTYNLTIYVYDIANNYAVRSFIITIDTLAPVIEILSIDGLIQEHGVYYIPANSLVTISISDDDGQILSTFSWGGVVYNNFADTFILSFVDGTSTLYINASDSLGNEASLIPLILTIDSLEPTADINSETVTELTKINDLTTISILVEDLSINTIKTVKYSWDAFPGFWQDLYPSSLGEIDFESPVDVLYSNGSTAILSVYVEDIVGNNLTYDFNFMIDIEPPLFDTFIYDEVLTLWTEINDIDTYTIRGNAEIWFTNISSDYYSSSYYWDLGDDSPINETSWIVNAPTEDGFHNLTIIMKDNTGNLTSPNAITKTFNIFIDDIAIDVLEPSNLLSQTHQISYKDTFNFTISIYDGFDNSSLANLVWHNESLNNNLNLVIMNNTIDNKTFEFSIYANNIGLTDLVFEFSQLGENRQTVIVSLDIGRKEGNLILLENSISAYYGNSFRVNITLEDELFSDLTINNIAVNGLDVLIYDMGSQIYSFDFNPQEHGITKGTYNLLILAESDFYFGETNDSVSFDYEVLPLRLQLTLSASNLEIIEGTRVEITATLTFLNGTPVANVEITFMIYVSFKTDPSLVRAAFIVMENLTDSTDINGIASISFEMSEEIEQITFSATFEGNTILDSIVKDSQEIIVSVKPPGLASWLLYVIIGASVLALAIVSFIIYRTVKSTPYETILSRIQDQDVIMKLTELCPGGLLTIFDQRRGAVPLITEHSLSYDYGSRMTLEVDNFILKVGDQAFSALGFEEAIKGRRLGSITLPNESMLGYIHGIQLKSEKARGGLENLVVTVLTDLEFGTLLLAYQEFLHPDIDKLKSMLVDKRPLTEIKEQVHQIRKQATKIILAAQELEK